MARCHTPYRQGMSLVEVVLATVILAAMAVAIMAYVKQPSDRVRHSACDLNEERLELLAKQYEADHGRMPRSDMRELTQINYYGEAIPRCPVNNRPYQLNRRTGEILPHRHP